MRGGVQCRGDRREARGGHRAREHRDRAHLIVNESASRLQGITPACARKECGSYAQTNRPYKHRASCCSITAGGPRAAGMFAAPPAAPPHALKRAKNGASGCDFAWKNN